MNTKTKTLGLLTTPRPSHKASLICFFFLESMMVKMIAPHSFSTILQILVLGSGLQPSASSKTLVAASVIDFDQFLYLVFPSLGWEYFLL